MDTWAVELAKSVNQAGLVGLLAAIIVTGIKAMWVPGFAYREKKAERDEAVAALDRFVGIHEDQTRVIEDQTRAIQGLQRELGELRVAYDRLTRGNEWRERGSA